MPKIVRSKLFELEQRKGFPYPETGLYGLVPYGLEYYALSYWRAAKDMIDNKLFKDDGTDFSTFPIAFLYRHALEVMLKAILLEHHECYSKTPELLLNRGHKLLNGYLIELRSVVKNAGVLGNGEAAINISSETWSHLEDVLNDWQEFDPDGMAFRYSIDKKGKKVLTDPSLIFNIEHFSQEMEQALESLTQLNEELDHLRYQDFLQSEGLDNTWSEDPCGS